VYGIQIAKALGCHVTTTCSTPNVDLCKSLGADEVIDYKTNNIIETLSSKGQVYTLVVDNVGTPPNLYKAASAFLTPAGKFVQIGAGMSIASIKSVGSNMLLPGFLGGGKNSYQLLVAKPSSDALRQLGEWMKEGKVKGVIDEVFDWEDAPKVFEKLKTGRARGKIVVRVPQDLDKAKEKAEAGNA
jgi:alkaline phosphatase D